MLDLKKPTLSTHYSKFANNLKDPPPPHTLLSRLLTAVLTRFIIKIKLSDCDQIIILKTVRKN